MNSKIKFVSIALFIVMYSGSCTKPKLIPDSIAKTDTIKKAPVYPPSPLAGTWKFKRNVVIDSKGCDFDYFSFKNAPGKDTCTFGYGAFYLYLDSITFYNDRTFKSSSSKYGVSSYSGLWSLTGNLLIFDSAQVTFQPGNTSQSDLVYWFLRQPVGKAMSFVTPYLLRPDECENNSGTLMKFEIDFAKVK